MTRTNMRRWEWKGDQQKKKANTTTTEIAFCKGVVTIVLIIPSI